VRAQQLQPGKIIQFRLSEKLNLFYISYDQMFAEKQVPVYLVKQTGGRLTENQLIEIVFFQLIVIFIIS
jgi:hypothetical protein